MITEEEQKLLERYTQRAENNIRESKRLIHEAMAILTANSALTAMNIAIAVLWH